MIYLKIISLSEDENKRKQNEVFALGLSCLVLIDNKGQYL